ncbi:MAG: hypothetical protein HKUEN01_08140 [Candidatus Kuenenia stuttgartiensis]|nr:MAG: hypothetical protein HKUEN01_08140 [Candidatus Kuenenia stuttgartiensis]
MPQPIIKIQKSNDRYDNLRINMMWFRVPENRGRFKKQHIKVFYRKKYSNLKTLYFKGYIFYCEN